MKTDKLRRNVDLSRKAVIILQWHAIASGRWNNQAISGSLSGEPRAANTVQEPIAKEDADKT